MSYEVWWPNPVIQMTSDVRTFETREEADRFMNSRWPKYGKFVGYQDPQIREVPQEEGNAG